MALASQKQPRYLRYVLRSGKGLRSGISGLQQPCVEYAKLLLKSPFRRELEEKIGSPAFRNMELAEKSTSEAIIPLKHKENALVTRYEKMMASAKIEWEGEIYNISQMTPFQHSKDRKIRQEAGKKWMLSMPARKKSWMRSMMLW